MSKLAFTTHKLYYKFSSCKGVNPVKHIIDKIKLFFFELTDIITSMKALQREIMQNLEE